MYIFKCEKSGSLTHGVFEALADFSPFLKNTWDVRFEWQEGERVITQAGSMEWNSSLLLIGSSKHKWQTFKHSPQIHKFTVLFILVLYFYESDYALYIKVSLTAVCRCCICTNLYFSLNQSVIISIREYICGWVLLNMSRWRSSQRHAATLTPSRD